MSVYVIDDPKGTGKFCVKINFNGKRAQRTVATREIADAVVRKINAQIELGTFNLSESSDNERSEVPNVINFTKMAIDRLYPVNRHEATNERYHSVVKKDLEGEYASIIGKKPVNAVSPKDIYELFNLLVDDGRKSKSIDLTRSVLHCCFKVAKMDKLIVENPMNDLPSRKKNVFTDLDDDDEAFEINPFTEGQMITFIDMAMKYSPMIYGPLFLCSFRTGMRLGEVLALKWENIDWKEGVILVHKGYRRKKIGRTKTRKARKVDMSDQLKSVLHDLYTRLKNKAEGKGVDLQPIIFHCRDNFRSQNTVRRAFKKILKLAGLPHKRVHDARHTFASILLSKGASINYIKDQLGHSSIATTSNIYGRFIPGTNRDTISLLDSPIDSIREQP